MTSSSTQSAGDTVGALVDDPAWLPHRVDLGRGALEFVRLTRDDHRNLTFLTDDYIGSDAPRRTAPLRDVAGAVGTIAPAPVHFVFHSAFCCSTLLARALDVERRAMGLKEPVALMNIADASLGARDRNRFRSTLAVVLSLLARPFGPGEAVVVKPTNIVNPLIEPILTLRPDSKALLLYSPLAGHLRSIAKKGLFGRIWARRVHQSLGRLPAFDPGYNEAERWLQTDLQVAALLWLQQQAMFARILAAFPGRVRSLDSESLLADPRRTLAMTDRLFGLAIPEAEIAALAAGPIFASHSKRLGESFDTGRRADENARADDAYGEEIAKVVHWAEAVAKHVGVPMRLDAALIGR
jgi:hypothetical protein